uniref:Phosphoinositide phospholipase C n=1 Tax=Latimeria chalumnae TaxID=7897 RepID=H2ZXW7_LATCH
QTQKLREVFNLDFPENNFLAKTLTVVSGPDMVDLTFHNFVSYKDNVNKLWAPELLTIAIHPLTTNASRYAFLEKIYVRLKLQLNDEGKIPVRNIYQMFPADRKKVESALSSCHLPKGKVSICFYPNFKKKSPRQLRLRCVTRPIEKVFSNFYGQRWPKLIKKNIYRYLNQKNKNKNPLLAPASPSQASTSESLAPMSGPALLAPGKGWEGGRGGIWRKGMCGKGEGDAGRKGLYFSQSFYSPAPFCFLSLMLAGQFSGISSPEMYRQTLLAGCRCVELDCWKGRPPEEEPIITHGFTMTTEILFKDVIEAIAESAFKTSQYPVILSFENHVDSPKQQAKMADYCRTIFGAALLTEPLEKYPLKPGVPVPSPQELKGKILIKNKKNQAIRRGSQESMKRGKNSETDPTGTQTDINVKRDFDLEDTEDEGLNLNEDELQKMRSEENLFSQHHNPDFSIWEEFSKEGLRCSDLSVQRVVPFFFLEKNRSYIISSFTETKAYDLLTKSPLQFVEYNKRQMSRIYPKGTRMDSSNYMPQMFWNSGCQMVALNFQTMDLPMQLNMALFEFNSRTGYLLKHEFLRRAEKKFDPFTVDRIDVVVANTLSITIISGQFLSDKNVKSHVEVELFGLPGDPKRKYRTKLSPSANSINPIWNEEPFVFEKILMPDLASLRLVALEEGGKFIGQRIIPVNAVRSGYHHICLHNESNMPLTMPCLFVYIELKDYIPDALTNLTVALTNPIKYGNQEKPSMKIKSSPATSNEVSFIFKFSTITEPNGTGGQSSPTGAATLGDVDAAKEPTELRTVTLEELRQLKLFTKLQKKQEKELKETEKKLQKRSDELVQKYSSSFVELSMQLSKKKTGSCKGQKKKWSLSNINEGPATESLENTSSYSAVAARVLELKEKLQAELTWLREEQCDVIQKRKEQHVTEQVARLIELAKEKQASELKAFKESADSDMKEMKKRMEVKRQERIENMLKSTGDKAAQERLKKEINNSYIHEVVQAIRQVGD